MTRASYSSAWAKSKTPTAVPYLSPQEQGKPLFNQVKGMFDRGNFNIIFICLFFIFVKVGKTIEAPVNKAVP